MAEEQVAVEAGEPQQMHFGTVAEIYWDKGFSRLTCEDYGDQLIYAHKSVAGLEYLQVGDMLCFSIFHNKEGKPAASSPCWRFQGNLRKGGAIEFYERIGRVQAVGPQGNAYVNCPDLAELDTNGKGVFLHANVIKQCQLEESEVIVFKEHINSTGQAQVSAPCWKCVSPGWRFQELGDAPDPKGKGGKSAKGAGKGAKGVGKAAMGKGAEAGYDDWMAFGPVVPVWAGKGAKGFGPYGPMAFGKGCWGMDMWDPYGAMEGYDAWGKGAFPAKGKAAGKGPIGGKAKGMYDGGKDAWAAGGGGGKSGASGGTPKPAKAAAGATVAEGADIMADLQDLVFGSVGVVEPERGFSRIVVDAASEEHGGERGVYCHKNVVDPSFLAVGETVGFRMHVNGKGQPAASAPLWKMAGPAPAGGEVYFGESVGRVGEIDTTGKSSIEDLVYGGTVKASALIIRQCGIQPGDVIAYSCDQDATGQMKLVAPCWACCSPSWLKRILSSEGAAEEAEVQAPAGKKRPIGSPGLLKPSR